MTKVDRVRGIPTNELVELLNTHGSVRAVAIHVTGQYNEQIRKVISDRIRDEGLEWNRTNFSRFRYTIDQVKEAFESAGCWSDIYRSLQITVCDHNKKAITKMARHYDVDIPIFSKDDLAKAYQRGKRGWVASDVFKENSTYPRGVIRSAVIRFKVLPEYVCSKCGLPPLWNKEELTLELDHINGVHTDNHIENLRWLCPNCHTQTVTFKGRNKRVDLNPP